MRPIFLFVITIPLTLGCSSNGGGENQGGSGGTSSSSSSSSSSSGAGGCTDASGCAADEYCAWNNEVCHIRPEASREDQPGACAPRAAFCGDSGPAGAVCGCDGNTYPGRCEANMAGVDVQNEGGCTPPTGMFSCGYQFCTVGAEFCEGWLGDGNDSGPDHYACKALPADCSPAACGCLPQGQNTSCTCDVTPEGGVVLACPAI